MRVGRNSRNSGRASSHCCISISTRAVDVQVAELVVLPLGEDQVHLLQGVEHREGVGLDRRVVVLLEERRAETQEVVERLEELRPRIRRASSPWTARPSSRMP